ncbi:hypothetical protein ACTFIW_002366, partial [Dictyostelium discoideum]
TTKKMTKQQTMMKI